MDEEAAAPEPADEPTEAGGGPDHTAPEADAGRGQELEVARNALPETIDHDKLPVARVPTAAPSLPARSLAFTSIIIGGLCGGLIGFAFTDLQCGEGGCTGWAGVGGVIGAVVGAVGVAIVAVLVLRAMDEWETVKERDPSQHPSRQRRGPT